MMTDLSSLLTAVFGVTTIIAAGLAGLVYGGQRTLRDSNTDLRCRVNDLEKERIEDKAAIAELKTENKALASVVTGEVHWHALTELLSMHHTEARQHWEKERALLRILVDRDESA